METAEELTAGFIVGSIIGILLGIVFIFTIGSNNNLWEKCSTKHLIQPKQVIVDINTNDTTYIYTLKEEYNIKNK